MAKFALYGLEIRGITSCVPKNKVSNWDYDKLNDSERKMLIKTIGVETRHVAPVGVTTVDLCVAAAKDLLQGLNTRPDEIDIVIIVTQSRDYYLPSSGPIVQERLGIPTRCIAFDIGLGCSGYVYGMSVMGSMLKAMGLKKGLLLAGDVSTVSCSYNDTSTFPLFGDAGSATLIESTGRSNEWNFELCTDGSGAEAIMIPAGCLRNLPTVDSFIEKPREDGNTRADLHLQLQGLDVFNFSLQTVAPGIAKFRESLDSDEFDYFIMHQANLLMNESIRKKLKIDREKTPYSIQEFGNTSSASIPLTITSRLKGLLDTPSRLLISGFGVGLSWANAAIDNDRLRYLNTIYL